MTRLADMSARDRARFYRDRNRKAAATRVRRAAVRAAAAGAATGHSIGETLARIRAHQDRTK